MRNVTSFILGVLVTAAIAVAVPKASAESQEIPVAPREPYSPASELITTNVLRAQYIELMGANGAPSIVLDGGALSARPQILLFRSDATQSLALAIELVRDQPRIVKYRRGAHSRSEVMAGYADRR